MNGQQLIRTIQKYGFEEFEIQFNFTDGHDPFPNVRTFTLDNVCDVGHSEKIVVLEGYEINK